MVRLLTPAAFASWPMFTIGVVSPVVSVIAQSPGNQNQVRPSTAGQPGSPAHGLVTFNHGS